MRHGFARLTGAPLSALVRKIFGIDLRTLALFRVATAVMLIADLVMRARDLTAHYSDFGILPRTALIGEFGIWLPSFHLMSGSAKVQAILFLAAGIIALALLIGYRTRWATVLSWVFLLSLQARNPAVSQGADLLLRLLLFWAMFLPLGARYSVDAALDRRVADEPNAYFSIATLALQIQVISVYFFTALLKTSDAWIPDGTAVYYALHLDYLATPFAVWLRQFPVLLQGLTYFVWCLEIVTPALMFSPVFHIPLRLAGMALLIAMHIGFFLCMEIGIFPFVSIASLLVFTPGWVWDRLEERIRRSERRGLAMYYDRPCEFCRKVCLLLRTFLILPDTPIKPAQDDAEIYTEMQAHDSWVVVDRDGSRHVRWDAIALVFRRSPLFRPLGMVFGTRAMRKAGDRIYETVARNRGRLAEWSAVALPYRDQSIHPSLAANAVIGVLLVLVVAINIRTLPNVRYRLPDALEGIKGTLRLSQKWEMFAPAPSRADGWYVVRGETASGGVVEVLHDRAGEPDWTRPKYLSREYPTYRWRKYLIALKNDNFAKYRPYYARYLCRTWNRGHPRADQLVELSIYFNYEVVPREYLPRQTTRKLLYVHQCNAPQARDATPDLDAGTDAF